MIKNNVPNEFYGILSQNKILSEMDEHIENLKINGFTILETDFQKSELLSIRKEIVRTRKKYINKFGLKTLENKNEFFTVRAPSHFTDSNIFLKLYSHKKLLKILRKYIENKFLLIQQNIIFNPPKKEYGAGRWHRDLPYQHFISSKPLVTNALFTVDDFLKVNGSTWVLSGSHKFENFPSHTFVKKNALQLTAKAGSFILLDAMVFHSGGINLTNKERIGINHVYGIPFFAQQIQYPGNDVNNTLIHPNGLGYKDVASYLDDR